MKNVIRKAYNAIGGRMPSLGEHLLDHSICGQSLGRYVPGIDQDDERDVGGTGTHFTRHAFLRRILAHVPLTSSMPS